MDKLAASLLTFVASASPCLAQAGSFFHVADVATDLSGATFVPPEIVLFDAATSTYAPAAMLPDDPPVDALHRLSGGQWLISVAGPTDLGGVSYSARDVIRFDGSVYTLELDGAAAGIPDTANVDALSMDGTDLILGFDVPTTLGATTYDRNDLARHAAGAFTLFFDASAAGVPGTSDVIGAAVDGAQTLLTFDIATDLGGSTYLPGELVAWDGAAFSTFHADLGWPASSVIRAFALDAGGGGSGPGSVPATLRVDRAAGGAIQLTWGASCSADAGDYAIYEGQLDNWYSHTQIDCSDDDGDRTETVVPSAGDRYYLVVPLDGGPSEGSYGADGAGAERPVGAAVCAVQVAAGC